MKGANGRVFNIEGSLDLIAAIVLATAFNAPPFMGATYWIPAFWVPALLVTHYITFHLLAQALAGSCKRASRLILGATGTAHRRSKCSVASA